MTDLRHSDRTRRPRLVLDARHGSRAGSERWSSTTALRRRRRRRCCTTISTSCTRVQAFLGALRGASLAAVRRGHLSKGIEDNSFPLFSELMDSTSLFLTANCDTVYFWGFIDLSDGPMVIDLPALGAPTGLLGTIDDMWFRWVTDVGLPGPDRGEGGRYLIAGPVGAGQADVGDPAEPHVVDRPRSPEGRRARARRSPSARPTGR